MFDQWLTIVILLAVGVLYCFLTMPIIPAITPVIITAGVAWTTFHVAKGFTEADR